MKLFYLFIITIFLHSCSFDNKSGIWENENITYKESKKIYKEFEKISSSSEIFNEKIILNKKIKFKLFNPIKNKEWKDIFYDKNNNFNNFQYTDENKTIHKSKKLTKYNVSLFPLYEDGNIITSDQKGNIIIYSIDQKKIISKFNFYKKQYKKIKKNLNLIVEDNNIYVSDNLGFLYSFNYTTNKIIWAKNYKIPFRSNLKLSTKYLFAANQKNDLLIFDKKNGDTVKLIPTEDTSLKNDFRNNLSMDNDNLYFLNTYGSLYSVDINALRLNWFNNLNSSINFNPSNLFSSNEIVNYRKKILVTSDSTFFMIDKINGFVVNKYNFSSHIKPIVNGNFIFLVTNNNFLISLNMQNGKLIYSFDINEEISKSFKIKQGNIDIKNIIMINNNIYLFLKNSYVINFDVRGKLLEAKKLPSKLNSHPIIINSNLLYLDKKNRVFVLY
jgi:outer membrane protein assembly factor BamB